MRRTAAWAILALAVAGPAASAAPMNGEYGVICFDPSIGTLKGTRVVLGGAAPTPSVLFQHCDRGCSDHTTQSARLTGDALEFEIASMTKPPQTARFTGRFRGQVLELKGQTASFPFKSGRLRKDQTCPRNTVKADP